jgi:hypothetical protein
LLLLLFYSTSLDPTFAQEIKPKIYDWNKWLEEALKPGLCQTAAPMEEARYALVVGMSRHYFLQRFGYCMANRPLLVSQPLIVVASPIISSFKFLRQLPSFRDISRMAI